MARVQVGPLIQDIRGSVKNVVFSIAKRGVNYVKSKPSNPLNPNSGDQVNARFRLQESVQRWFNDLNPGQRQTWEVMADRLADIAPAFGAGGIRDMVPSVGGKMSGVNAYVGFRSRSILAGLGGSFSDIAPVGERQPTTPLNVQASYDTGTNIATITWTDPSIIDAAGVIGFWLRSRQKVYHKQFRTVEALAVETLGLADAKSSGGGNISFADVEPQDMLIQLQSMNPSGYASEGSQTRGFGINP